MEVLKLNFDASVTYEEVVAAFIIRDHQGVLVRVGGKKLQPSSIPFVEMVAPWMGVKVAVCELQVLELWVEWDSQTII